MLKRKKLIVFKNGKFDVFCFGEINRHLYFKKFYYIGDVEISEYDTSFAKTISFLLTQHTHLFHFIIVPFC